MDVKSAGETEPPVHWKQRLPQLVGVVALSLIALGCVFGLVWVSAPQPPTGDQLQAAGSEQAGETTQAIEATQDGAAQPEGAPPGETTQPGALSSNVAANAANTASTIGVSNQIASVFGTLAAACVGGISGMLVPRR